MNPLVLKMQLQDGLRRWAIRVCFAHGLLSPKGSQPSVWANWLYAQLPELCALESSNTAVEEFEQLARELMDVVLPPEPVRQPGERVVPQAGTANQLSQAAAVLGYPVSKHTIRHWAKTGKITGTIRQDGAVEYQLDEVMNLAKGMQQRIAETHEVNRRA
ncbi:hypothetical protein [Corynebacterium ulceribovis]|uniref:hypothetical protein n=1 Tax=Corynebacterium ulceribovis TaxID=487732 RepID=UPI000375FA9F|nr:hypothetical protein [Corynebacterium ulceribovis]